MKKITIIDTETQGLDPLKSSIMELAAIFYDVQNTSIISQCSVLFPVPHNPVEHINKINPKTTEHITDDIFEHGMQMIQSFVNESDAVVAHYAAFDKAVVGRWTELKIDCPWICSYQDIQWSEKLNLRRRDLATITIAHNIPVWQQHRALTDCIYLSQIFSKYKKHLPNLLTTRGN